MVYILFSSQLFQALTACVAAANAGLIGLGAIPSAALVPSSPPGLVTYPNGAQVPIEPLVNQVAKAQHLASKPIIVAPTLGLGLGGVKTVVGGGLIGGGLIGGGLINGGLINGGLVNGGLIGGGLINGGLINGGLINGGLVGAPLGLAAGKIW